MCALARFSSRSKAEQTPNVLPRKYLERLLLCYLTAVVAGSLVFRHVPLEHAFTSLTFLTEVLLCVRQLFETARLASQKHCQLDCVPDSAVRQNLETDITL